MVLNLKIILLAALVPLVIGFLWYGKMGFQNAWMKSSGVTEEQASSGNMPMIFGLSYVFSVFLAVALNFIVIHQNGFISSLQGVDGMDVAGSALMDYVNNFQALYGGNFRTFGHGVLHGVMNAIMIALPLIGMNALFERRGFKYIFIHLGYWVVCMGLMGGIICQFS